MTNILFVTQEYLENNLPITRNLDSKTLTPNIKMSQEINIQDILGSVFYEYLLLAFSGQTLSSDEATLVQDYIKPATAYRGLCFSLPFVSNLITNKGAQQQREDYSSATPFAEFKFLLSQTEKRADFYEARLIKYLCLNSSLFPLYVSQNGGVNEPNSNKSWNSGLGFY